MSDDEIYEYLSRKFEWNRLKAMKNVLHHHIRFTDAASVFLDPYALFRDDPDHSEDEDRYIVIGISQHAKTLVVVHVYREEVTRIISARKPTQSERRDYESRLGRQL